MVAQWGSGGQGQVVGMSPHGVAGGKVLLSAVCPSHHPVPTQKHVVPPRRKNGGEWLEFCLSRS